MKNPKKTQVYYKVNGIPHYDEFKFLIPTSYDEQYFKENSNYKGPNNLWDLLVTKGSGYSLCRDDGPAVHYINGCKVWRSTGHIEGHWFESLLEFTKNTNHILCKICNGFCGQEC